jgi:fluoroacetyl-CoA thioesterase
VVKVKLIEQQGRQRKFAISAHDGVDTITEGTHERVVIDAAKFNDKLKQKMPLT